MHENTKRLPQELERQFFRLLNRIVEPAVRAGIGSPRFVPGGLIVLESRGFKSGSLRRTPLVALRIRGYVIVSTVRGERSFWVRNLIKTPATRYWLAGKPRAARALVLASGKSPRIAAMHPGWLRALLKALAPYTRAGWAFAVLCPVAETRAKTRKQGKC